MKANDTQKSKVKKHLLKHKTLTSWEAIVKYRITRLAQYILELRGEGMKIVSENKYPKGKNWYTLYKLGK